jgi:hypothetical protein
MSIIKTITNDYEFAGWVKQSDSYSNKFTLEGAKAVQEYYEQLSDDLGENIEFDPIAWCCEWSEYDSLAEAYKQWRYDYTYVDGEAQEYFNDNTILIELDNGHVIIQEF